MNLGLFSHKPDHAGGVHLVEYHRFPYDVLEFESNNLKTMDLSTKGAAWESPGSVRRRDATKASRDGKSLYVIGLRRPGELLRAILGQAFGL